MVKGFRNVIDYSSRVRHSISGSIIQDQESAPSRQDAVCRLTAPHSETQRHRGCQLISAPPPGLRAICSKYSRRLGERPGLLDVRFNKGPERLWACHALWLCHHRQALALKLQALDIRKARAGFINRPRDERGAFVPGDGQGSLPSARRAPPRSSSCSYSHFSGLRGAEWSSQEQPMSWSRACRGDDSKELVGFFSLS